jgi:hypothetical protein
VRVWNRCYILFLQAHTRTHTDTHTHRGTDRQREREREEGPHRRVSWLAGGGGCVGGEAIESGVIAEPMCALVCLLHTAHFEQFAGQL